MGLVLNDFQRHLKSRLTIPLNLFQGVFMEFRKQIDHLVKGSLACVEAMCVLRESIQVWDSDSYNCMDNLCKAYAHFADELTIFVKSDELSEVSEEES